MTILRRLQTSSRQDAALLYRVGGSSHISWYFLPWVGRWRGWLAGGRCLLMRYFSSVVVCCNSVVLLVNVPLVVRSVVSMWYLGGAVPLLALALLPAVPARHQRLRVQQQVVLAGEGKVLEFSGKCNLETTQRRGGGELVVVVLGLPWCRSVAQHPGGPRSPAEHRGQLGELRLGDR